jgi:hypothetical protein
MLRIDPSCRPRPEIAANVVAISLFRFGKDLRQFFRTFGLHWFWSMENMRSTFSNVRHQMEAKIRDMTELYATETILARFINPAVISSAELQVDFQYFRGNRDGEKWSEKDGWKWTRTE